MCGFVFFKATQFCCSNNIFFLLAQMQGHDLQSSISPNLSAVSESEVSDSGCEDLCRGSKRSGNALKGSFMKH